MDLLRRSIAEAVGTFALVFAGCGAIVVEAQTGALGHAGVSAVFGLVIAVMVFAVGHISGAHFNPGVTIAFALIGEFRWREAPAYIAAQVAAAVIAALGVAHLIGMDAHLGATLPAVELLPTALLEVVMTFFLMFVITAVATDSRASGKVAALAIGGTVGLCALFGGPLTGASLNPARSLGPALVGGTLESLWLYILAPIVGASLGALAYRFVQGQPKTDAAA
ncbi:MAG TPA: aquaporin [Myxococcota bacterium]|nr:aquaporin [Myxococcota bacterium]